MVIKLVKDLEDGTKQYNVIWQGEEDLRKKIFEYLVKENITIVEMKKPDIKLEDAFMNVINKNNTDFEENSEKLIKEYKGNLQYVLKPDCGHHPHGLEDSTEIANFIEERFREEGYEV